MLGQTAYGQPITNKDDPIVIDETVPASRLVGRLPELVARIVDFLDDGCPVDLCIQNDQIAGTMVCSCSSSRHQFLLPLLPVSRVWFGQVAHRVWKHVGISRKNGMWLNESVDLLFEALESAPVERRQAYAHSIQVLYLLHMVSETASGFIAVLQRMVPLIPDLKGLRHLLLGFHENSVPWNITHDILKNTRDLPIRGLGIFGANLHHDALEVCFNAWKTTLKVLHISHGIYTKALQGVVARFLPVGMKSCQLRLPFSREDCLELFPKLAGVESLVLKLEELELDAELLDLIPPIVSTVRHFDLNRGDFKLSPWLRECKMLERLLLFASVFQVEDFVALGQVLATNRSLVDVVLRDWDVVPDEILIQEALNQGFAFGSPTSSVTSFTFCAVGDVEDALPLLLARMSNLTNVALRDVRLDQPILDSLVKLKKLTQLTLKFGDHVDPNGLAAALRKLSQLRKLKIGYPLSKDEKWLSGVKKWNPRLQIVAI